jgi:hypothetical protein
MRLARGSITGEKYLSNVGGQINTVKMRVRYTSPYLKSGSCGSSPRSDLVNRGKYGVALAQDDVE